ncbi:MAG: hypothetical protein K6F77_04075 [Lachnospiraceae bacterium]|nr:hypothetical protein [Lachnospiraceae bacterium]
MKIKAAKRMRPSICAFLLKPIKIAKRQGNQDRAKLPIELPKRKQISTFSFLNILKAATQPSNWKHRKNDIPQKLPKALPNIKTYP